ncbi:DUF7146 domain-containing protein [Caenimonas aquaedulcis]|uniref:Toprim domain-containing protein n=1 Tax=Caenimonas aquaedulcis TaxID=2793270 RepID=A0A931H6I5_9BURK|nr:toprim domain-containing protein [Caenimonas aquaedulcis]MBG9389333.1 toprim domain-containing protein [Caenimonas aquaedulcis]
MSFTHIRTLIERLWPGCCPADFDTHRITRFATDPSKRHSKSGWIRLFPDGAAVVGDFRADFKQYVAANGPVRSPGEARRIVAKAARLQEQQRLEEAEMRTHAKADNAAFFDSADPLTQHDLGGKYLHSRHVYFHGGNKDRVLRFHKAAPYFEDRVLIGYFPAILSRVTDVNDEAVAIHRTYLDPMGGKARVGNPKKLTMASAPLVGSSIKLFKPRVCNGLRTIAIAEGLETAVACFVLNGVPVEAATSASLMRGYVWHRSIENLLIYTDNDENGAGQIAGAKLATRAHQAGLDCRILTPRNVGEDWADVLMNSRAKEQRL